MVNGTFNDVVIVAVRKGLDTTLELYRFNKINVIAPPCAILRTGGDSKN